MRGKSIFRRLTSIAYDSLDYFSFEPNYSVSV